MKITPEKLLEAMAAAYDSPSEKKFRRKLSMPCNSRISLLLYKLRKGGTVWRDMIGNDGGYMVAKKLAIGVPATERGNNGQSRRYMRLTSVGESLADEVIALAEKTAEKMNEKQP